MGLLDIFGFGKKRRQQIAEFLEKGALIVDVRSQSEFASSKVEGSINVPLESMQYKVSKLKNLKRPLILICVSGRRSGLAANMLKSEGIDCMNGGSWRSFL